MIDRRFSLHEPIVRSNLMHLELDNGQYAFVISCMEISEAHGYELIGYIFQNPNICHSIIQRRTYVEIVEAFKESTHYDR